MNMYVFGFLKVNEKPNLEEEKKANQGTNKNDGYN